MATINRQARAFGYLRVSTDGQADSGLGLEAQRAAVEAAAARLGLALADVFTDAGLSGSLEIEARPGLSAAVDALRRGDVLLCAKRDRIGRDLVGVALVERMVTRKGARIVSASGEGTENLDPGSVLQRQIIDVFAEFERRMISYRTKAALQAKRVRGERTGTVPFGFRLAADGRTLEPHPAEQEILSILRELHAHGFKSREIAEELNAQGFTTRRGSPWRRQYVESLVA